MNEFTQGQQIAYVPTHAEGDLQHPDVEFGFVFSDRGGDSVFCRYWRKGHLGQLRTVANSELTPRDMLVAYVSVPQEYIDVALERIEDDNGG